MNSKKNTVVLLSLIGHFENAANYIKTSKSIKKKLDLDSFLHFRFWPRDLLFIIFLILRVIFLATTNKKIVFLIPRSNSTAIIYFIKLFHSIPYYTYCDGIGDIVHKYNGDNGSLYLGHLGCNFLTSFKNVIDIPISICYEPWLKKIKFNRRAPLLIIFKYPKEIKYNKNLIDQFYSKIIRKNIHNKIYVSANYEHPFSADYGANIVNLGPLSKLSDNIEISGIAALPSTVLFGLANILPEKCINVLSIPRNSSDFKGYNLMCNYRKKALIVIHKIKIQNGN